MSENRISGHCQLCGSACVDGDPTCDCWEMAQREAETFHWRCSVCGLELVGQDAFDRLWVCEDDRVRCSVCLRLGQIPERKEAVDATDNHT